MYEKAVQSPDVHVDWYTDWYKDIRKRAPRTVREDFCGTFAVACEFVTRHKKNTSMALDLEPECLEYGRANHLSKLTPEQQKRVKVMRKNVLSTTSPGVDMIIASNFSFNIFHHRRELVRYFKHCHKSLNGSGVVILEMAGGPGMIEKAKEPEDFKLDKKKYTYIWHQKDFDPITRIGDWAIHFKLPNGKTMKDAFTYHWRLWTVPELREAMEEAGFKKSIVYWETTHKGKGTDEYAPAEHGGNDHSFVAYIVGVK